METFPSGSLQYGSIYDLFWYAISLFQIDFFSNMYLLMNMLPDVCKWMLPYWKIKTTTTTTANKQK